MASSKPPVLRSALSRISTNPRMLRPNVNSDTGTRPVFPALPPPRPSTTQVSTVRMAPAMVFVPSERPIDRIAAQIEKRRTPPEHSVEWEDDEKTPVDNPYRIVDGKVVNMGEALPSAPPEAEEAMPPTVPETPHAILTKIPIPPAPVLNVTWVENRGTRIRNGISFFLLACFIVAGIAGATWAFLWNGRNHQQLLQHQREEQEKQDRYK